MLKSINEHKNLLKYINSWYDSNQNIYIIIEELCRGGNINSNYKYIQKPKIRLIKKWIKEILTALDYLHSNNIIHHDIKCENIYLDRISGNLKIGCIGSIESLPLGSDHFEKYAGTPEFMAPEVNEGKYNFKSDIYSLGLSLIELLTVQKPYKECEGSLNIYINKKKGIMPESFKLIQDKGIREFIMLCLSKENKRPTAKELLEYNEWLNNKNNCENNTIIEIKGALRQKNFFLNNKYKSDRNIYFRRLSSHNTVKYNSKIFQTFNLLSKSSWRTNRHSSNNDLINISNNNINYDKSSFSSNKNNMIYNKSTTTSRTDNFFSKSIIHNNEEENHEHNKIIDDFNSNNVSRNFSSSNIININNSNAFNQNNISNNSIINKPIIKEKNDTNNRLNPNYKKYFSPEQNNRKEILIPHLNLMSIQNKSNNYSKLNSFRETIQNKINSNSSAIKSINILYDENEYDNDFNENEDNDNDNECYINYNIIYSIKFNDDKILTCEYNYGKDTVEIIINNLKEIMNLDANDIILLKNEFAKKIQSFIDKKRIQIFFQKYYIIINNIKILGNMCKKFDKIFNVKNFNSNEFKEVFEKINDYQTKKNIINIIDNYKNSIS